MLYHMYAVHKMRPVTTDVTRSMVCMSVCLCIGHMDVLYKTAEPIQMPFRLGGLTYVGPRKHVLDGVQVPPHEMAIMRVVQPIEKYWESLLWYVQQK